jgi:F420-dependent oxidoreductase-like protein
MRIGKMVWASGTPQSFVNEVIVAETTGFATVWTPQVFGWDALTLLALAGSRTEHIELGTAVVPVFSRHPLALAASALTTASVAGGRLTLGIGPAHRFIVEDIWGLDYRRPFTYTRDYLGALTPALAGRPTDVHTGLVTARLPKPLDTPQAPCPPVLLAAMAPRMLELAAAHCAGTITLFAGINMIRDTIVPTITRAVTGTPRPDPRVVVGLPVCVTRDARGARDLAARKFAAYSGVPAYERAIARDGAGRPADVALIGSASEIEERLSELAEAGATDLMAWPFGDPNEERTTCDLLTSWSPVGRSRT